MYKFFCVHELEILRLTKATRFFIFKPRTLRQIVENNRFLESLMRHFFAICVFSGERAVMMARGERRDDCRSGGEGGSSSF
jgi:hypothetical protein